MDMREAVKTILRLLFENLEDEKCKSFSENKVTEAIEIMHDDDTFFDELLDFFDEHLEIYGGNYGL